MAELLVHFELPLSGASAVLKPPSWVIFISVIVKCIDLRAAAAQSIAHFTLYTYTAA